MSLFRKNALDALSTPEKLDEPTRLIKPNLWLLLISLSTFTTIILSWSIFGRIPIRISGNGLLTIPGGLVVVQAEVSGKIKRVNVKPGDCVSPHTELALIEPTNLDLKTSRSKLHLNQLIQQDKDEDSISEARLKFLQSELSRVQRLVDQGAMSVDQYSSRLKEYDTLKSDILSRGNQREFQIAQERANLIVTAQEIKKTTTILSSVSGCIVDFSVSKGKYVQPGETLFLVEDSSRTHSLQSLAFFPAKDGKRIKIGQLAKIVPATSKQARHGAILGTVTEVSHLPVRRESVLNRLGLQSLLSTVNLNKDEPLIEVTTNLRLDPSTFSGYDWGGAPGPELKFTQGTPTQVRVLVEERSPISYIIPILRDLTSIY